LTQIKAHFRAATSNGRKPIGRDAATAGRMMTADRKAARTKPLVIVIDDDAAVRGSLKFALEIEGFAVRAYARDDDLFGDHDLDGCACLIVDQKLPGLTGLDLVAVLRQRHIAAPVILITSHPTILLQERAARAGVPIVEKPLLGNALLEKVRSLSATTR
jgi:FixJ family two-component response regulator